VYCAEDGAANPLGFLLVSTAKMRARPI
jgi:hypothetical protein